MNKSNLYIGVTAVVIIGLTGCLKTEHESKELSPGSADFYNYIAIGNSLTQGFQDFGLHNKYNEQENSFPATLAGQMKLVSPDIGEFVQPLATANGSGYMHLAEINGELEVLSADDLGGYGEDASWTSWADKTVKYNNLGVAGIRLTDCVPTAGDFLSSTINQAVVSLNPFGRFLDFGTPIINNVSYLDHVKSSGATFFTCWLGNNDLLLWCISGGEATPIEIGGFGLFDITPLTPANVFRNKYDSVLTALSSMGADGVCSTIPDITTIPLFNTINEEATGYPIWITEGNGVVRVAEEDDLILLSASDYLADGAGQSQSDPLPTSQVLDKYEAAIAREHTITLNEIIIEAAEKYGFALVDNYNFLRPYEDGVVLDGVDYTTKYIEGGVFSLDGIHPNPKGHALTANAFIEAINQHYGSTIPKVEVGNYKGIIFPN